MPSARTLRRRPPPLTLLPLVSAARPSCSYEEYVPLKKRRQMEDQVRLARLGRAPQQTSSADTGGRSGGEDSDGEADHRQKESLLVMKAKQMQEVGGR